MKTPIKVKLVRKVCTDNYRIASIVGAVTLGAYNGRVLRVGDVVDEKEATNLAKSYHLTLNINSR